MCNEFGTDTEKGLQYSEIEEKRSQYGDNKLPAPRRPSYMKISMNDDGGRGGRW